MSQPRVFEFAKEVGLETLALMDKIRVWKLPVRSHMEPLTDEIISEIKSRLADESSSKKSATTTKKKPAVKKAAAKSDAPKANANKAAAKPVTKSTVKKAAGGTVSAGSIVNSVRSGASLKKLIPQKAEEKIAPSEAKSGPSVIRRKAGEKEARAEEARQLAAAQAASLAEEAAAMATEAPGLSGGEQTNVDASAGTATIAGASPSAPATPVRRMLGGNIVGRIELKRPGTPTAGPGSRPPQRPTVGPGNRNLRTGFVAVPSSGPEPESEKEKQAKEEKRKPAAAKEQNAPLFISSDFRKREVIFQAKKKKPMNTIAKKTQITTPKAQKRVVKIYDTITVGELADQIKTKSSLLVKKLMTNGVVATINTTLDFDTATLLVADFGYEAEMGSHALEDLYKQIAFGDLEAPSITRPPVVTVMGHVDHGKTTLLDSVRNASVASGEAGGITQHIGAYQVKTDHGDITFIDTPGHEAFTHMRARGAKVTDVAVIVVAADDGVMPQTAEAINHAKAAGVPIVIAINKMDKPGVNPDRIKQQLTEFEIVPEEWGGTNIFCNVSALKKTGIKELLEQLALQAEVLELKANPKRSGQGIVIESRVEKGKGSVATVLVQEGTIQRGQVILAGQTMGRVRSMLDDHGHEVESAMPGQPVEISGLEGTPSAGDVCYVCRDEESARSVLTRIREIDLQAKAAVGKKTLEEIFGKIKNQGIKELPLILKTDVAGSLEAIKGSLEKIESPEVKLKILHTAVGGISENDILLASTTGALVIGFGVRPDSAAQSLAKQKSIDIKTYRIIYELIDDVKKALGGLLAPEVKESTLGHAQVRELFSVPKIGTIAGCAVTDGKIARSALVRVVRDGRVIYEGKISSLRRFKDDAKEVAAGYECGIGIENFNDIKVSDVIEAYETKEIARGIS